MRIRFIQRETLHRQRVGHFGRQEAKGKRLQNIAWLIFMGWVIWQANVWEDYSNYLGEGAGIPRNWATTHFLAFYGWPQNCHGTGGCVTQLMLIYYNEHIMRLKVPWKSNLPPSRTQSVLTSFVMYYGYVILLKVVPCPLPSCFTWAFQCLRPDVTHVIFIHDLLPRTYPLTMPNWRAARKNTRIFSEHSMSQLQSGHQYPFSPSFPNKKTLPIHGQ